MRVGAGLEVVYAAMMRGDPIMPRGGHGLELDFHVAAADGEKGGVVCAGADVYHGLLGVRRE